MRKPKLFFANTYLPRVKGARKRERGRDDSAREARTEEPAPEPHDAYLQETLPPLIPKYLKLGKRIRIADSRNPEGRLGCFIYGNDEYIAYVDESLRLVLQAVGSGMVISLEP